MQQVNRFSRYVLPGLAFKAVVIGGGYATGREIATFFLPSGAIGGLYGLLVSTAVWSVICAVTFLFALQTRTADYRSFFRALLGPFWRIYEIAYFLALVLLLAVFAAAAGAIGHAVLGSPPIIGTLLLMALIVLFAAYGNDSVERLFKYVSFLLYGTYALFVVLSFVHFGDRITNAFATGTVTGPWAGEGMTYAGYNIIGAIVILPVTRHLMGRKDALIAGVDRRSIGRVSRDPVLHLHGRLCRSYPRASVALGFLAGATALPGFPHPFSGDGICSVVGERNRRRTCHQPANRSRISNESGSRAVAIAAHRHNHRSTVCRGLCGWGVRPGRLDSHRIPLARVYIHSGVRAADHDARRMADSCRSEASGRPSDFDLA